MKTLQTVKSYINPLFTRDYWQMLADYVGLGRKRSGAKIVDRSGLADFLHSRSSHVAQTSLYGYLRTRAGTRFPQLFENEDLLKSINIAKWHVWLAAMSDLGVHIGQNLHQSGHFDHEQVKSLMSSMVREIVAQQGDPDEAGPDYAAARDKMLQRVETCDWTLERDDDTVFSHSPEALYYWAPIAEELKEHDESIVKNSIRYRWIEVRRATRDQLDYAALHQNLADDSEPGQ